MTDIRQRIIKLKEEKNALILAHFYETMDIQQVADIVGDSFELAKKARLAKNDIIVMCGVRFMAESAKILNPGKKVLFPVPDAGCPMADMIDPGGVELLRAQYPEAAVVCYVNSSVGVKAESDICCTSSSAEKVVRSLPNKQIIFVPDKNLGSFVAGLVPEKDFIFYNGYCPIHDYLTADKVNDVMARHSGARLLVHPECREEVRALADFTGSTAQILAFVAENEGPFVIGTEIGIVERMKTLYPQKEIYLLDEGLLCPDMKKITISDLLASLEEEKHEILIPEDLAGRARQSLERMAAIG